VEVYTVIPATWEAEAGWQVFDQFELHRVPGQFRLYSKTLVLLLPPKKRENHF
jgi:hypothetical protein